MQEFEVPIHPHKELNPKLWNQHDLKQEVQVALLKIAKAYYVFLGLDVPVVDIVISGSQANYNYSEHSDIDLHIIVNYSDVHCDMDIDELFDTKRKLWKEQHDIDIYGIPVEVYVEDKAKPAVSSTYSLLKNTWVTKPEKPVLEFDEDEILRLSKKWISAIGHALRTQDLELCEMVKDLLWAYRKKGLSTSGEYGTPNLVFKLLRNTGASTHLLDAIRHLRDQQLSI